MTDSIVPTGAATPAPDEAERERIRTDLDSTLFVEAGAGAGKTSSLVARIVNLVRSGVPITGIAAITFTEKAAAELRSRTRRRLEAHPGSETDAALSRLDHAPIGTLHSFARRILFDFPIEAGLPPGFTVLDELESGLAFEEQWNDLLDRLLDDAEPAGGLIAGGRAFVELCEFDGFGVDKGARRLAEDFRANWDLVHDRVELVDPGPLDLDLAAILQLAAHIGSTPIPNDDKQVETVAELVGLAAGLRSQSLRIRLEALWALDAKYGHWGERKSFPGAKGKWTSAFGPSGADALEALRADETELGRRAHDTLDAVKRHRRLLLGAIIGRFVLDGATERASSGRLEFHDLLVLARRLLTDHAHIRRMLHERYERILLDEFQDTDPIQLEIAVRLTADPDDPAQRAPTEPSEHRSWRDLLPLPGRLFIVGDPKQSIYRFRRADISQYLRAAEQVGADNVRLSANFRSTRAVIDFANNVFGHLISYEADVQPAFQRLDACRPTPRLGHGTVSLLGVDRHDDLTPNQRNAEIGSADALRLREAADVAAAVSTALADGWPVFDEALDALRPCRPGDICILLPTRISLPSLEAELRRAALAYRAENSSVVYATTEIRQLLLALRAADDPTDTLALVEVLRSPLYGCSDVELWEWKAAGGTWNLWSAPPPDLGGHHPVAAAIAHVRSVAERVGSTSAAELLASVADERRVFDLALAGPDARDVWRRLRFVIEQARAWADAGGHGVRRYLQWATLQASESRVADTILPENDHDAVRVMTIHAAKGLEFPITIVAGLTTKPRRAITNGVVWANDTWMLAGRGDDGVFVAQQPIDEQMGDAERRRLLYVACTRAADHLVVSLHRGAPTKSNATYDDWGPLTSAELLWAAGAADPSSGAHAADVELRPFVAALPEPGAVDWADPDAWSRERNMVFAAASRRTGIAATRLSEELAGLSERDEVDDAGLDKRPVNVELPPWQRGRYGTSIGRAVHGVLQFCDLSTGTDIDNLARAQCAAEGVMGLEQHVAALARSALAAPIVRAVVAGAEHWRELFVAAPIGDRVLEGYVDLLVRTVDGLVIVDYKTDQWSGPVQSAERIGRYRLQLAAYGAALGAALEEPIVGGVLVRCSPKGDAEQILVDDWSGALDEVRLAVR
ncbi:MAG TPA: UvrD-helicase domain-containing protein [Ilumatobacteraceae bacterium]|nr:UvrD-helicase domain-containing protein [Ilumatobacteraceae bacterium]